MKFPTFPRRCQCWSALYTLRSWCCRATRWRRSRATGHRQRCTWRTWSIWTSRSSGSVNVQSTLRTSPPRSHSAKTRKPRTTRRPPRHWPRHVNCASIVLLIARTSTMSSHPSSLSVSRTSASSWSQQSATKLSQILSQMLRSSSRISPGHSDV